MSAFPTADRRDARQAFINALRAADGLPPTERPTTTTWRSAAAVVVGPAPVMERPSLAVPAIRAAPGAVVSYIYFLASVLRIRIRTFLPDPDLFAGSGSGQIFRIRLLLPLLLLLVLDYKIFYLNFY